MIDSNASLNPFNDYCNHDHIEFGEFEGDNFDKCEEIIYSDPIYDFMDCENFITCSYNDDKIKIDEPTTCMIIAFFIFFKI